MTATPRPFPGAPPADVPTLTIVRAIAAPVSRVFAAWTDPALLQRWLAPGPLHVEEAAADARPGGTYRIVAVDPLGFRHVTTGEYLEVIADRLLVQSWVYDGADPPATRYPTLLTVEFRALAIDRTELTIRQDRLITAEDRAGNRMGWEGCLLKLELLLREGGAGGAER